jgi:type VI protein secretion system component VasK
LPRVLLTRALLVALPFVVWFVWREVARRTGRPMGSTPWAWLVTVGALLVGLSLMATAVFHADNRRAAYVPAQTRPDGSVAPGRFVTPPPQAR